MQLPGMVRWYSTLTINHKMSPCLPRWLLTTASTFKRYHQQQYHIILVLTQHLPLPESRRLIPHHRLHASTNIVKYYPRSSQCIPRPQAHGDGCHRPTIQGALFSLTVHAYRWYLDTKELQDTVLEVVRCASSIDFGFPRGQFRTCKNGDHHQRALLDQQIVNHPAPWPWDHKHERY
jgi:hypothetical protein